MSKLRQREDLKAKTFYSVNLNFEHIVNISLNKHEIKTDD